MCIPGPNATPTSRALISSLETSDASHDAARHCLRDFNRDCVSWNLRLLRQTPGLEWKRKVRSTGRGRSLAGMKCIQPTRREYEDLLTEFNRLMSGGEATLPSTGVRVRR